MLSKKKKPTKTFGKKQCLKAHIPSYANIGQISCLPVSLFVMLCLSFADRKKMASQRVHSILKKLTSTPNIFLQKPQKAENT